MDEKWERTALAHQIDEKMGFSRYDAGKRKEGWLVNIQPTSIDDPRVPGGGGRSALDCYFMATVEYEPYFFIACCKGHEGEVQTSAGRGCG